MGSNQKIDIKYHKIYKQIHLSISGDWGTDYGYWFKIDDLEKQIEEITKKLNYIKKGIRNNFHKFPCQNHLEERSCVECNQIETEMSYLTSEEKIKYLQDQKKVNEVLE